MRRLVIGMITFVIISSQSYAGFAQEKDLYCTHRLKFAEVTMRSRQVGVDINDIWDNKQTEFTSKITIDAYSSPVYLTEEYQEKAIANFAVKYYIDCIRNYER